SRPAYSSRGRQPPASAWPLQFLHGYAAAEPPVSDELPIFCGPPPGRRPSRQLWRRVRAKEESSHSCIVLLMLGGCLPDFSVNCGRVPVLSVSAVGILFNGGNIMLHLIWYIMV